MIEIKLTAEGVTEPEAILALLGSWGESTEADLLTPTGVWTGVDTSAAEVFKRCEK